MSRQSRTDDIRTVSETESDSAGTRIRVEKLLTPRDVAAWLNVSVDWVQDHASAKEPRIPSIRIGKLLRFRHEDVGRFIAGQAQRRAPTFNRDLRLTAAKRGMG